MPDLWIIYRNGQPVTNGHGRLRVYLDYDLATLDRGIEDVIAAQTPATLAQVCRQYQVKMPEEMQT